MKAKFIGEIVDRTPNNPSLSCNGGDYWFWRKIFQLEDGRRFCLYKTSSDFDYCQITGSFTETCGMPLAIDGEEITVNGKPLGAWVSKWMARTHEFITPHILDEGELSELDLTQLTT